MEIDIGIRSLADAQDALVMLQAYVNAHKRPGADIGVLDSFGMTVREENCLRNENITTIEALEEALAKGDNHMMRIPNLGSKALGQLKEALAQYKIGTNSAI